MTLNLAVGFQDDLTSYKNTPKMSTHCVAWFAQLVGYISLYSHNPGIYEIWACVNYYFLLAVVEISSDCSFTSFRWELSLRPSILVNGFSSAIVSIYQKDYIYTDTIHKICIPTFVVIYASMLLYTLKCIFFLKKIIL